MATVWLVEEDSYESYGPAWVTASLDDALALIKQYQARSAPDSGWTLLDDSDDDAGHYRVYLGPEAHIKHPMFHIHEHAVERAPVAAAG